MMPEAAHDPGQPRGNQRQRIDALIDQAEQLLSDIAKDPDRADLAHRLSLNLGAWRETRAMIAANAFSEAYTAEREDRAYSKGRDDERAAAAAPAPARRRPRHAAAPGGPRPLWVVPGFAAGPIIALRGLVAGRPVHIAATATVAVAAVAGGGAIIAPHVGSHALMVRPPAVTSPLSAPDPAASRIAFARSGRTARTGRTATGGGKPRLNTTQVDRQPPLLLPVPTPSGSPPDGAAPLTSPPPAGGGQVTGRLEVSSTIPSAAAGGVTSTAQITLTAAGGPVDWQAWTDNPDVTLTLADGTKAAQGHLHDGEAVILIATIDAPATITGGKAVVHVWPGRFQVTLTWDPAPAPSESPLPPPPTDPPTEPDA